MIRRMAWLAVLTLAVAACSKGATTASGEATGESSGGASAGASQPVASAEGMTVQGSLTTSGAYDATWTWQPGNSVELGDLGGITLTSDEGAFANVSVKQDGTVSFGSGEVSEIGPSTTGSGAQVTLDGQNMIVCGFTVDTDLTGAPGGDLHLSGTMAFVGSDGVFTC
jgi:hypothetical protein